MSFDLQLKAALLGSFEKELAAGRNRVAFAAQSAMDDQAQAAVNKLRADVAGSGLRNGSRLSKTWRAKVYPTRGNSLSPAAEIESRAPLIVSAFEEGETIRSGKAAWLTIPNPKLRLRAWKRKSGRSVVAQYEQKYGPLRFVKIRADLALLVTDLAVGRTGRYRAITEGRKRLRQKVQTVVVFYLVRQARMPRMLKGATIRARIENDFPRAFQRDFDRYLQNDILLDEAIPMSGTIGMNAAQAARVAHGLPPDAFEGLRGFGE